VLQGLIPILTRLARVRPLSRAESSISVGRRVSRAESSISVGRREPVPAVEAQSIGSRLVYI
jgi:hypothetical protein